MHIITKAMKLFSLPLVCLIILPSLFAFQQHDSSQSYTHPAIVVSGGVSYISVKNVDVYIPITNTDYWTPLLSTAPTDEPGDPPTTEPDTSDSNIGNLTPPEDNIPQIAKQVGLSSRGFCGSLATDPLIAGFNIEGNSSKSVIVTAKGPSLPVAQVPNPLANPKLYVVNMTSGKIAGGPIDNWRDSTDVDLITSSGRAPSSDLDSAIVLKNLEPGSYSAICYGDNITGTALVEVYELEDNSSSQAKFVGLSTRGFCGPLATDPRIVGFIVDGDEGTTTDLYIGAKGPSLPSEQVSNPLADPSLYVVNMSTGKIAAGPIDNWEDGNDAATLIEVGRAPSDPKDAALILRDLSPGSYSAIAYGTNGVTGTVLVEAYEIELD
jgi:hypothetical protein